MGGRDLLTTPYIWVAFTAGLLVAFVFLYAFPLLALAFIILPVPEISDVIWGIAKFPVTLFGLELPAQDSAGYVLRVAARFYAPLVFLLVFGGVVRLGRKGHDT